MLLPDMEEQSGSSQEYGSNNTLSLHNDESLEEERTANMAMSNPMASISGDIDLNFVTIDLDTYGEDSSDDSSVIEACGGLSVCEEELVTLRQRQQRWMTRLGQGLKNALTDLKLFFW